MDEFDMDVDTEFSEIDDTCDTLEESALDALPDIPEDCLEDDEDIGPVLAKTYDGWGTVFPSDENTHNWEGDKNLERIYDNVIDNVSKNEDLSNDDKIRQLESLKEQWLSEFE